MKVTIKTTEDNGAIDSILVEFQNGKSFETMNSSDFPHLKPTKLDIF